MKNRIKIKLVKFIALIKIASYDEFKTSKDGVTKFDPELARCYWSTDGLKSFLDDITIISKDMIIAGEYKGKDFMIYETITTVYQYIWNSIHYLANDPQGKELLKLDMIGQSAHWKVNVYQHIEGIMKSGFDLI